MRRIKATFIAAIIGSLLSACGGTPAQSAAPTIKLASPPIAVVSTPAPSAGATPSPAPSTASGVLLVIQGESATLQGAGQYTAVSDTSNIADTHRGYLYLGDGGAKAVYRLAIPEEATYFVWIRVNDDGLHASGARSVSVSFADAAKDWVNESRDTRGWVYEAVGSIPITEGSLEVAFTKLETTSAAFSMDEFILSSDEAYDPNTTGPTVDSEPAAGYDPISGIALGPSVADACALLPVEAVRNATGHSQTAADPTYYENACLYIDLEQNQATVGTAANRYVDAEHARAAAELLAKTPSQSGRPWVSLPGYDDLFYATGNGEIVAVSGTWLVMLSVYQVGSEGAGTLTEVAKQLVSKLFESVARR